MKKGELKRGQILETAERLFFEKGYDRTSIQDILDALRLSKGGFYHYFDAKETVLREICQRRWAERFDALGVELAARRSPVDKLNLLLGMVNLFEEEDERFAAMILKLCYRDGDAVIAAQRRRVIIDNLTPRINDVMAEGIAVGALHARRPMEIGRLLLMLACDVNDEACAILASEPDNPDRVIRIIEMLNTCREAVETLSGAPYGSITLFDPGRMVSAWQLACDELKRLEEIV